MINDTPSTEHPAAAWAGENIEQILDIIYLAKSSADQQEIPADELRKIQERELRPMWLDQTDNPLSNMARNAVAGDNADLDRTLAYLTDQQTSLLLRHCILLGHLALALTLLTRVSDVDWKMSNNETALMLAAGAGHHEIVTALLHRGASVEAEDSEGWTALSRACRAGQLRVIRLLLDGGSDADHLDRLGRSCLQLAEQCGHQRQLLRLLSEQSAEQDVGTASATLDGQSIGSPVDNQSLDEEQSLELHQWLNSAGFTSERAQSLQRFADFIQQMARGMLPENWTMTGSYADGWANSLIQVNGRTGADSDIDWTIIMPQVFHLAGGCHCEELRGNKRLQVVQGHAQVEVGTGNQPAVAAAACGMRPAQDTCYAFDCCSGYCKQALMDLQEITREDSIRDCVHLVKATRPNASNELRVSFSFEEKKILRKMNSVQGQLFTLLKFTFKRYLPGNLDTPGLKTYNAKTIMFFMLKRHHREEEAEWQPKNLIKLLKESLDMMLSFIESNSSPDECMPHFFMPDAPLYFKNAGLGGDFDNTKSMVRDRLRQVRSSTEDLFQALQKLMQPLQSKSFYFHPFTLLPLTQPSIKRKIHISGGYPHYADVYGVICYCVKKLHSKSCDKEDLLSQLKLLESLPWCKSAVICLTAMAHLKFKDITCAVQLMKELISHKVMNGLKIEHCGRRNNCTKFFLCCQSHGLDWAWRFCLPWTAVPEFPFLPEFTSSLLTARIEHPRSSHLYLNFRCLSWSLQAELLDRG
ncbi:hypothetical protein BOX15_Mlig024411g1 [Macrostomum lignano]|uniref:Uncharacterized protein n=2 Tax=Macrostomum lignano TaxID=282301 RepID=A0A267G8N7_9PLAT|nr:hypothetical protein BOX15_Mlig024411g1 [Macrostomum lignano]